EPQTPLPPWSGAGLRARLRVPRFAAIWVATAVLFAVSPVIASGSVSRSALLSMLPFAGILAIAAIGQTLIIQQRGLDLSVPGMITLTTIIVTKIPNGHEDRLPKAFALVLLACVGSGLISGIAVTWLNITPLVATLGVNALLQGVVFQMTSGASTAAATPDLARFALEKTAGIPNTVLIAAVAILLVAGTIRATVIGRRFVAVGASPAAAHAAGVRVGVYKVATYVLASITYGVAGVLVAGFLGTPGIGAGNDYLLPTIAAVVLGGTSLAGGLGSVVATGAGALFLTQLEQVVRLRGAPPSVQFVIQGSIIALGMAVGAVHWRRLVGLARRRTTGRAPAVLTAGSPRSSHPLPAPGADDPVPGEPSPTSHPRDDSGESPSGV
ncbi:MAG TPA: ABC transporter permease, partial [Gaiellales bacterium]